MGLRCPLEAFPTSPQPGCGPGRWGVTSGIQRGRDWQEFLLGSHVHWQGQMSADLRPLGWQSPAASSYRGITFVCIPMRKGEKEQGHPLLLLLGQQLCRVNPNRPHCVPVEAAWKPSWLSWPLRVRSFIRYLGQGGSG